MDKRIPPFIHDQRVHRLVAASGSCRKIWLEQRFGWRRPVAGSPEEASWLQQLEHHPERRDSPCGWFESPDRTRLCVDPDLRLICITDEAGLGKTIALQQFGAFRQSADPGHLVLRFEFSELPVSFDAYLGAKDGESRVLLKYLKLHCGQFTIAEDPEFQEQLIALIRNKAARGQLTLLVDALDQTNVATNREEAARSLALFLAHYPRVRCVVTGRPYAVLYYWEQLFNHNRDQGQSWEFLQLGTFEPKQCERFLGTERYTLVKNLDAEDLSNPRSLEAILEITDEDVLGRLRTKSDIYWYCIDSQLKKAFRQNPTSLQIEQARMLYALLGFETVSQGYFARIANEDSNGEDPSSSDRVTGIAGETACLSFQTNIWEGRGVEFQRRGDFASKSELTSQLNQLAGLNAFLEPGMLAIPRSTNPNAAGQLTSIFWRNRTLQDFFAALWVTRYGVNDDVAWLRDHIAVRYVDHSGDAIFQQEPDYLDFWRLAAEMPGDEFGARQDACYAAAMSVLFEAPAAVHPRVRPTELMYRSWGHLTAIARNRRSRGRDHAEQIRSRFLSEYVDILSGSAGPSAREIALRFERSMVPVPKLAGSSLRFHMGDAQSTYQDEAAHESEIGGRFALSQYPVPNELYDLFCPGHRGCFGGYDTYSPGPTCPAIYLSWYDSYCVSMWLGGRLPSEQEWEYACRGQPGTADPPTRWSFGNDGDQLKDYAWYTENTEFRAQPLYRVLRHGLVKPSKLGNGFDLYHMHGSVWEWTSSWYAESAETGRGQDFVSNTRVVRGGSFYFFPGFCRSACRNDWAPALANYYGGVRVARALS